MMDRETLIKAVRSLYPDLDKIMTEVAVDFHLKYPDSDVDAVLGDLLTGQAREFFSELDGKRRPTVESDGPDAGHTRDQSQATPVPPSS
jgi:hypothetical protein